MLTLLFLIGRGCYQIGEMNYKEKKMTTTIIEVSRAVFYMTSLIAILSGAICLILQGL